MDTMLTKYRPRLSTYGYSEETGFLGYLEWYDGTTLVERLNLDSLHAFGVALVKKPYGLELVYGSKRYAITAWPKQNNIAIQVAKNP